MEVEWMMRVVLAQPRGFCAGVERAIELVERALARSPWMAAATPPKIARSCL